MEQFLEQYGYLALLVGTFFEGETAILVASSLIHQDLFEIPFTVLVAFMGSFFSDWLYYSIGYLNGKYFLAKRPRLEAKLLPVQRFLQNHSIEVLLTYRFLYGFRVIIPVSIGLSKIRPAKFLLFSVISGLIWASLISAIGYGAGAFLNLKTEVLEKIIFFIVAGFAIIGALTGYLVKRLTETRLSQS